MAVRHDHEIQFRALDSFFLRVVLKDIRIIPGVEQTAFAAVRDKRGIAPIFLHLRGLAEASYSTVIWAFAGSTLAFVAGPLPSRTRSAAERNQKDMAVIFPSSNSPQNFGKQHVL